MRVAFCDWLFLLSVMFSKFIHAVVCHGASFPFGVEQRSKVRLTAEFYMAGNELDTQNSPG